MISFKIKNLEIALQTNTWLLLQQCIIKIKNHHQLLIFQDQIEKF